MAFTWWANGYFLSPLALTAFLYDIKLEERKIGYVGVFFTDINIFVIFSAIYQPLCFT
jgi:hypothetical protein